MGKEHQAHMQSLPSYTFRKRWYRQRYSVRPDFLYEQCSAGLYASQSALSFIKWNPTHGNSVHLPFLDDVVTIAKLILSMGALFHFIEVKTDRP